MIINVLWVVTINENVTTNGTFIGFSVIYVDFLGKPLVFRNIFCIFAG